MTKHYFFIALFSALFICGLTDQGSCDQRGFDADRYHAYFRSAENVANQIDRSVGSSCVGAPRKFVHCQEGACADAEAMDGCKTANDLKHTLYNVRNYIRDHKNDCRNYRIVSHGGSVASRIRSQ
uniref:Uncharacterized protein n=1 Tax=Romanomermis culicivorax TaxID=13658 RepID=A0A915KYD8_ROMCU